MINVQTWVVLSDGRYIKILINKGEGKALTILNADDMPAYAELCYLMVNGKPLDGVGDLAISSKINNVQCQVNFLTEPSFLINLFFLSSAPICTSSFAILGRLEISISICF